MHFLHHFGSTTPIVQRWSSQNAAAVEMSAASVYDLEGAKGAFCSPNCYKRNSSDCCCLVVESEGYSTVLLILPLGYILISQKKPNTILQLIWYTYLCSTYYVVYFLSGIFCSSNYLKNQGLLKKFKQLLQPGRLNYMNLALDELMKFFWPNPQLQFVPLNLPGQPTSEPVRLLARQVWWNYMMLLIWLKKISQPSKSEDV